MAAPLDPPDHRGAATHGAKGLVQRIGAGLEPPDDGLELEEQLIAAIGHLALTQPVGNGRDLIGHSPERTKQGVDFTAKPLAPDRVGGELVEQPDRPAAFGHEPAVEPFKHRLGITPGVADGRGQFVAHQLKTGPRENIRVPHQLADQGRHEPPAIAFQPAQQAPHPGARELPAQVGGRHILEMMGLIENQPLVGR